MKTKTPAAAPNAPTLLKGQSKFHKFLVRTRKNWQLHMLAALPVASMILFKFVPMYGIQIAFRNFRAKKGIWGSDWVGLANYKEFFNDPIAADLVINTLSVTIYSILVGFPIPIILALLLHVNEHPILKKATQNVAYVPHFISTVVLVGIVNQVLSPVVGFYGAAYKLFGGVGYAPDIRASAAAFRHIFVWSGVWQQMGWNTIIYVAALAGVSHELHEAAELDGASRWKRVLNVDLPAIMPTVLIMFILRFGTIMTLGYEKVLLLQNDRNLVTSEVLSTYVYKIGLIKAPRPHVSTAVDLFTSMVNLTLVLTVNGIVRKLTHGEQGMF